MYVYILACMCVCVCLDRGKVVGGLPDVVTIMEKKVNV